MVKLRNFTLRCNFSDARDTHDAGNLGEDYSYVFQSILRLSRHSCGY